MTTAVRASDIDLRLGRWEDVLGDVECDALIVDAPYSERTHVGHDEGVALTKEGAAYRCRDGRMEGVKPRRQSIDYGGWDDADVTAFVSSWAPRVRGWFVSITDHVLAPAWAEALEALGRYVFSPLAFLAPGSRVRLVGDGPAQWACWIIVARPRHEPFSRWGSLPGGYVLPAGQNDRANDRLSVTGGKPLWLMQALVRDYTRPGDLVCDPCAGGGTTLLAAAIEGRRAVGAEMDPAHFEIAKRRIARGYTPTLLCRSALPTNGEAMPRGQKKTEALSLLPDELDAVAEKYRKALAPLAEREEKIAAELAAVREKRLAIEECLLPLEKVIAEHRARAAARERCTEVRS